LFLLWITWVISSGQVTPCPHTENGLPEIIFSYTPVIGNKRLIEPEQKQTDPLHYLGWWALMLST